MKKYLTKLTITNSVNDDKHIEWGSFETEDQQLLWRADKELEQKTWNFYTPGAMSCRHYDFTDYSADDLLNLSMEDFYGMSLREFLLIIKEIS